jgi:hypothetical protein
MCRSLTQHVGGRAIPRPDLKNVVAEIKIADGPWEDFLADVRSPFVAAAYLVVLVHHFIIPGNVRRRIRTRPRIRSGKLIVLGNTYHWMRSTEIPNGSHVDEVMSMAVRRILIFVELGAL